MFLFQPLSIIFWSNMKISGNTDKMLYIFFRKTDSEDSESNPDGGGRIRKKFKCFCFCCGKNSSDQDSDSDDEFSENHVNGGFEQEVVTNGNNPNS